MNGAREKLHSARQALDPILGRRRATTEAELDECVQTLEELKRAATRILGLSAMEAAEAVGIMRVSFDEVIGRIKHRAKGVT